MTRLFFAGAEGNNRLIDASNGIVNSLVGNAATFDSALVRSGSYAWKFNVSASTGGLYSLNVTGATGKTYYMRAYYYISTFPTTNLFLLTFENGAVDIISLRMNASNQVFLFDDINSATLATSSALSANKWYKFEIALKIGAGANDDYAEAWIDDVSLYSSTILNLGTTPVAHFFYGAITVTGNDTFNISVDDVALNDSNGSVNNSRCGDGKVIILMPKSDNARGANWVAGAAGTTNLWDAVNNKPPVGVANASATTTSQIRNATSDTTGNYDANLETYYSKGIKQTDQIVAVEGVFDLGCSSATATNGATRVLSNPAEGAETSVNFSSGAIAGTWNTNWKQQFNSIIEKPFVNVITSPVLRVGKRQATTRVGMCDFMGLLVEYIPMGNNSQMNNQAVNRAATF